MIKRGVVKLDCGELNGRHRRGGQRVEAKRLTDQGGAAPVGDDDHRMAAGTFMGSPQPSDIRLMAAVPLDEARRIWVTDEDNKIVLDAQIPAPA